MLCSCEAMKMLGGRKQMFVANEYDDSSESLIHSDHCATSLPIEVSFNI